MSDPSTGRSAPARVSVTRLPGRTVGPGEAGTDLFMTAADRRRVRRPIETPDGLRIELALPTGTVLPVGAVLCEHDGVVYVVRAAPERTLVVRPRTLREAAEVGHLIGNMHRDVRVGDDGEIVTLHAEPLERRLRALAADVRVEERPFLGDAPGEHAHG